MHIIKTKIRNKLNDDFLTNSLILYIERKITTKFSKKSILNDFEDLS